jgi:hypothetical protein
MREGRTLWMPSSTEWAWNGVYDLLGQRAAARGIGLFNPTTCGSGPDQDVPLKVWASSNPPGPDTQNLEGEWIKVQNLSYTTPISLDRWWVRDSMLERFTFPRGTTLPPRATITVHTGPGADTPSDLHWGLSQPIFGNANADDRRDLGDGAYLFDPQGDLRAWMLYPCLVDCTDPNEGALALTAQPRRSESVTVTNISGHPIDLYGYQLLMDRDRAYWFAPGTVLDPGQSLPVAYTSMRRRGDSIRLSTFNAITLACTAWGDGRC